VLGTLERYPNETAARSAIAVLLAEINSDKVRMGSRSITVAQLCDHFEQRELAKNNTWRSYSTKKTYRAYLNRWVLPHWRQYELAEVRTIQVESWLRRLPTPTVLMTTEIKALVDNLGTRERTLVLLAVSTGLRQSELFGLKWGDIAFLRGTKNVTRSIVYRVVGLCKTEASQKPVPVHPLVAEALTE
jgi:integrase